ncbi:hypothetical protein ABRY23_12735 [Melioribacteraceae bacterium 4301-Me]|uniref:hypothetical protein n=1 Tax=Pyranulibacter aquaticus TaxID=3163344 RepID=UPI003594F064
MFEREIKFIYDFNLNKISKLGPYFTFEQLRTTNLHPAFLQYISAEIDYLIFEDRQKLLKDSVFDYSGEKIGYYFEAINSEIKKTKRFSLDYISKLILHASSFTVNYLVRPIWTLNKFIFDESSHKTTIEIRQILNYVYYYKYLPKIINSYFNSKKIISIDAKEFSDLLNRIEKLSIESYLNNILESTLKAMSEFFNIGEIQKTKIPLVAVRSFLLEKKLDNYVEKLDKFLPGDENTKYDIGDFKRVFSKVLVEKEMELKEPEKLVEEKEEIIVGQEEKVETEQRDEEIKEGVESKSKKLKIKISDEIKIEQIDTEEDKSQPVIEDDMTEEEETENLEEIIKASKGDNALIDTSSSLNGETNNVEEHTELAEEKETIDKEEALDEVKEYNYDNNILENTQTNEQSEIPADESHVEIKKDDSMLIGQENQIEEKEELSEKNESDGSTEGKRENIDITEILEHKDMTKVIKVIFDYDIEEFANAVENIMQCKNFDEANTMLEQILKENQINANSKEAEIFKSVISEFFQRK